MTRTSRERIVDRRAEVASFEELPALERVQASQRTCRPTDR